MRTGTILWQPDLDALAEKSWGRFSRSASEIAGTDLNTFEALHAWSVEDTEGFWNLVWDFTGIVGDKGRPVISYQMAMPGARFFPESRLNFAENLLRKQGIEDAIVFRGEDKAADKYSWDDLRNAVSRMQQFMVDAGICTGDRVAAMMPNMPETVIGMLAATSLGAVWSSCSPDFGEGGVLDRFGQIEPKMLIACDGYWYNGKQIDVREKLQAITAKLPTLETKPLTLMLLPCTKF